MNLIYSTFCILGEEADRCLYKKFWLVNIGNNDYLHVSGLKILVLVQQSDKGIPTVYIDNMIDHYFCRRG